MKQAFFTWLLLLLLPMASCSRRTYVPLESVRTDTFVLVERDTISIVNEAERLIERMSHDTICITERITHWVNAADSSTLRTDRERDTYVVRAREASTDRHERSDTLIREHRQTEAKTAERADVQVEVEKPAAWWERLFLTKSSRLIIILLLGVAGYYLYKKRK